MLIAVVTLAPASSAVEYEQVVFVAGTKAQRSPYQGATKEVDELWTDLYNGKCTSSLPHSSCILTIWNRVRHLPDLGRCSSAAPQCYDALERGSIGLRRAT